MLKDLNYFDNNAQIMPQQKENVRDFKRANTRVKIRISNSKEVKNMITLLIVKQDWNGTKSSRETCRILRLRRHIMAEFLMAKLEFMVVAFFKAERRAVSDIFLACSFGLPKRSSDNSTGGVHRIHTRSVHHEHCSLLTSTDPICACGPSHTDCSVILVCLKESVIWSAMSSPCWSLPHLLSSSPPQHEAPPGQHDLLQDNTAHRAPLPQPIQSTISANEPLAHVNYESGGNPRNTSPTKSGSICEISICGAIVNEKHVMQVILLSSVTETKVSTGTENFRVKRKLSWICLSK